MFTGELTVLSGRRGLVPIRAAENSELIAIEREALQGLVETDSELSYIFLRAFILRRLELIAHEVGDIVLIGFSHSLDTLRIKEFLTRNYQPYSYIDLERDAEVQEMLDRFSLSIDDLPVLICRGTAVLLNPTNEEITECLGFNEGIDHAHVRDLIIVGAGPAGLAAAVYAASEAVGIGPVLKKFKKPLSPNTKKISPSKSRATNDCDFHSSSPPNLTLARRPRRLHTVGPPYKAGPQRRCIYFLSEASRLPSTPSWASMMVPA
jgi:hypothetical protein